MVHALHHRHGGAHAGHRLRHLDADRPGAEHKQALGHLGHGGDLAVRPHPVESRAGPRSAGSRARSPWRSRCARWRARCRRPPPGRGRRCVPGPRRMSIPLLFGQALLAGVVVPGDHEVPPCEGLLRHRRRRSPPRALPAPRERPASASPGAEQGLRRDAAPSRSTRRRAARAPRSPRAGRRRRGGRRSARRRVPPPMTIDVVVVRAQSAIPLALSICVRGRDQPDVAERLREVAELLVVRRVDLLGQQPEVVRVADELIEEPLGPLDLAGLAQGRRRARTSRSRTCPPRRSARPRSGPPRSGTGARARPRSDRGRSPRSSNASARRLPAGSRGSASGAAPRRARRSRTTGRTPGASRSSRARARPRGSRRGPPSTRRPSRAHRATARA